jgi:ABC-2 type transport system permease protein
MSALATQAAGAMALVRRDFFVFASYRARMVTILASGFVSVALFYYVSRLVTVQRFVNPDAYFAFVVVGIAIMGIITSTLSALPLRLRQELLTGTFERLVVSPFGAVASIAAMTVFPLMLSFVTSASSIAFAAIVFGMPLHWQTVPLALPTALLAAVAFAPFALLVTALVLAFKQAGSVSGLIVTGLSFVGGFLFPVALLPHWIQWASEVQPFTPAVDLLRHFLVDTPMRGSIGGAFAKLILFGLFVPPFAILAVSFSIRYGQRKGTVTEY